MIFKKRKCPLCETKYPADEPFHELRLQVAEGTHSMEICTECADFLDKSADVLKKGKKNESL